MAPALTEPLSPKEKLSNSTATASPATRSNKKLDTSASSSRPATKVATPSTTSALSKEKKSRTAPTPVTSTRITRSRDASQRNISNTSTGTPTAIANTQKRNSKNSNDQMGLSAARSSDNNPSNNNNNNIKDTSTSTIPVQIEDKIDSTAAATASTSCKDSSTEQLLADLTNDFEEAITAEICLRKQLPEVNLSKEVVTTSDTVESANKNISNNLVDEAEAEAVEEAGEQNIDNSVIQHMDAQLETEQTNTVNVLNQETHSVAAADISQDQPEQSQIIQDTTTITNNVGDGIPVETVAAKAESETEVEVEANLELQKQTTEQQICSRLQIISVEELAPIGTDSTMTASEVEDNIEERLSQLDGNALPAEVPVADVPITTPARPTSINLIEMEAQIPLTPPPQQSTQQIQHQQQQAYTPQSTSSTVSGVNLTQSFLKESAAGVSGAGGPGGQDLEDQDIEEVLKALKGFDGSTASDICDLNVFFNEVYNTTLNYEEINSQQATSSTSKMSPLKEGHAEIEKKQQVLNRKIDFLLRRMRKVQARYLCKHTSTEIAGLFEWSARVSTNATNPVRSAQLTERDAAIMAVVSGRPPLHFWQDEKKQPVPSAQMCAMLRQLETVANAQQLCNTAHNSSNTATALSANATYKKSRKSDTTATSNSSISLPSGNERKIDEIIPTYDTHVSNEVTHVAGLLQTEMREVQNAIDSDATESSSGGESADEMVTYNNQNQQPLSIAKRAVWRYSRDRAAIAERWSWLLSQVTDLEIKIRQHSDLNHELTRSKGAVLLETLDGTSTEKSSSPSTSSTNGYTNNLVTDADTNAEQSGGCSRTRGFIKTDFRKRKLFQTTNMHTISKKAARPSNIKCGCQWPQQPCTLCTGRADPTAQRDLPDTMMMSNRVALLDPGFHPVLSFPEDICQTVHFESIGRMPDWQYRVMRSQAKAIVKNALKAEREAAAAAGGHHHGTTKKHSGGGDNSTTTKRRYIKKKDRLLAADKNGSGLAGNGGKSKASTSGLGIGGTTSTSTAFDAGNGTGNLSTTSTTPLVANKLTKKSRKRNSHSMILDATAQVTMNNNKVDTNQMNNLVQQQPIINHPQNYEQYNQNQVHLSTISNSNNSSSSNNNFSQNKSLKHSTTSAAAVAANNYTNSTATNSQQYNNHQTQHNKYNGINNDISTQIMHNTDHNNWSDNGLPARSRNSSPTHHGGGSSISFQRSYDRKNRISYDIDNIVIPYSIAAATRVEILPYKEIPTPKWRVINQKNENKIETETSKETLTANISCNGILPAEKKQTETQTRTAKKNAINGNGEPAGTKLKKLTKASRKKVKNMLVDKKKKEIKEKLITANESKVNGIDETVTKQENLTEKSMEKVNNMLDTKIAKNYKNSLKNNDSSETQQKDNVDKNLPDENKNINNIVKVETTTNEIRSNELKKNNNIFKHNTMNDIAVNAKTAEKIDVKMEMETKPKVNSNVVQKCTDETAARIKDEPESKKLKLESDDKSIEDDTKSSNSIGANSNIDIKTTVTVKMMEPPAPLPPVITTAVQAIGGAATNSEDISDESMMLRHQRALIEERRKFQTFLKFPWSTRSRANRRIDSRAESSGANTPDPTSPAPHSASIAGADNESIPSPLAQTVLHNPLDTVNENGDNLAAGGSKSIGGGGIINGNNKQRQERRRTTSAKNRLYELERRSSSPDLRELYPPYEPLQYPLSDETYQKLVNGLLDEPLPIAPFFNLTEDCQNTSINKATTTATNSRSNRYGYRNDGATVGGGATTTTSKRYSKSAINCDVNSRRSRNNKNNNTTAKHRKNNHIVANAGVEQQSTAAITSYQNGKGVAGDDDDDDDEDDDDEDEDASLLLNDDLEDDYPKHHLAPNDEDFYNNDIDDDGGDLLRYSDEYGAYVGRGLHGGLGDSESDETEPFPDDDPNDPEWKGGSGERFERLRRKV